MTYTPSPVTESRYSLIANLCKKKPHRPIEKILGAPIKRQIVAAKSEVKEEVTLAKAHDDDQSTLDEGQNITLISPNLARMLKEVPTVHAHHVPFEECLSPREHKQLAEELAIYRANKRKQWWLAIITPNPFVSMKVAEPVAEPKTVSA